MSLRVSTTLRLLALIALAITFVEPPPDSLAASSAKDKEGWHLVQKNEEGDFQVWATKDAVRAFCNRQRYSVIAAAPTWEVFVVDANKKIYAKVPWRRFETQGLMEFFQPIPLPTTKERKTQASAFEGVPAKLVTGSYPQNDASVKAESVTGRFMLGKEPRKAPQLLRFSYTVSDQMGTSQKVNTVLRIFYGLPAIDGFPLAYSHVKADGKRTNVLITKSMRKDKLSADNFDVSTSFKQVKRPLDVIYKAKSQEMNDIFESLGVGTEFGSGTNSKEKKVPSEAKGKAP